MNGITEPTRVFGYTLEELLRLEGTEAERFIRMADDLLEGPEPFPGARALLQKIRAMVAA